MLSIDCKPYGICQSNYSRCTAMVHDFLGLYPVIRDTLRKVFFAILIDSLHCIPKHANYELSFVPFAYGKNGIYQFFFCILAFINEENRILGNQNVLHSIFCTDKFRPHFYYFTMVERIISYIISIWIIGKPSYRIDFS